MPDDPAKPSTAPNPEPPPPKPAKDQPPVEIGGRKGLDPTRYGDWEINGRCIDF